MLSMYQMGQEWQNVFEMLRDPEIPEEAVYDTIEMIEADMDAKADAYGMILKDMDGDIEKLDGEIKRLQARKVSFQKRREWMKGQLFDMMKGTGRRTIKTALFTFSIQKNGGARPVDIIGTVPECWLKPGAPDTVRIRKALEQGESLTFAVLMEPGESLRIK